MLREGVINTQRCIGSSSLWESLCFYLYEKNPLKNHFVCISPVKNPFANPSVCISPIKIAFENPFESKFTLWPTLVVDSRTGVPCICSSLRCAAWLALWGLTRLFPRTAPTAALWEDILCRILGRFQFTELTMPTCSVLLLNLILVPLMRIFFR